MHAEAEGRDCWSFNSLVTTASSIREADEISGSLQECFINTEIVLIRNHMIVVFIHGEMKHIHMQGDRQIVSLNFLAVVDKHFINLFR